MRRVVTCGELLAAWEECKRAKLWLASELNERLRPSRGFRRTMAPERSSRSVPFPLRVTTPAASTTILAA